jgi:hypothetical protein
MSEQSESTELVQPANPSVTLSIDDWKNVLAAMEVGIKTIGYTAFVSGGQLMESIQQQLNEQMKQ